MKLYAWHSLLEVSTGYCRWMQIHFIPSFWSFNTVLHDIESTAKNHDLGRRSCLLTTMHVTNHQQDTMLRNTTQPKFVRENRYLFSRHDSVKWMFCHTQSFLCYGVKPSICFSSTVQSFSLPFPNELSLAQNTFNVGEIRSLCFMYVWSDIASR